MTLKIIRFTKVKLGNIVV